MQRISPLLLLEHTEGNWPATSGRFIFAVFCLTCGRFSQIRVLTRIGAGHCEMIICEVLDMLIVLKGMNGILRGKAYCTCTCT